MTFDQLARIGAAVGIDVRHNAYAGPDAIRDAGQSKLAVRLRPRLAPPVRLGLEVPLPNAGDQRAWDGYLTGLSGARSSMPAEFETRLDDVQAQTRRLWLKARDAGEADVLLVVADTQRNRDAIRAAGPALLERFPISARRALRALAEGRHPGGSALIFL